MADKNKGKGPMTPEQCREQFYKMIGMEVYCDEPNRVIPEGEMFTPEENRRRAWEFALGMIQTDGLVPTPEFMDLIEKEIRGEITDEDLLAYIKEAYSAEPEGSTTEMLVGVLQNDYASNTRVAEISKILMEQNQQAYNTLAGEPQAGPIWDEDTQRYI